MLWSLLSAQPTAMKLSQAMGYFATTPQGRSGLECCLPLHLSRVQLLLALPDESSLYTKGRVSGYLESEAGYLVIWSQRQSI